MGQAGAGEPGDRSKGRHATGGQIRSESPGIADTDPGGSPPRTAGNDTHRSVGVGKLAAGPSVAVCGLGRYSRAVYLWQALSAVMTAVLAAITPNGTQPSAIS